MRVYRLLKKYDLTLEQFEEMFRAQDGRCGICRSAPLENERNLAVDHDHDTGVIRGLLCGPCNTALGLLKDDPEILRRAAEWIERSGWLERV